MENKDQEKKLEKDSFCSYCGTLFTHTITYPKHCDSCMQYAWGNPIPVVVVLFTVEQNITGKLGLLIQRRNIDPQKGNWALTSGYINHGEDWRSAAVRESLEELKLTTNPNKFSLHDVVSGKNNSSLLIFCSYRDSIPIEILSSFQPNEEVQALDIMWEDKELAFPSHTEAASIMLSKYKSYVE